MPSFSTDTSPPLATAAIPRRKNSSPTHSSSNNSSGSAFVYPVPDSVAWLEQLSLRVTTSTNPSLKPRETKFVLQVRHLKANVAWNHARSFDDYRSFQQRLRHALQHGHFCHAECPWLYTYVKSYFPKSYVLGALVAPKQVVLTRREALERFVLTLQTFLVNRSNHCCSVLTAAVADEVLAFINGDEGKVHQRRVASMLSTDCAAAMESSTPSLPRRSWDSNAPTSTLDESDAEGVQEERADSEGASSTSTLDDDEMCRLCNCHLAEEAKSPVHERPSAAPPIEPTSPIHANMSPAPAPVVATPATLPPRAPPIPIRRAASKSRAIAHTIGTTRPHFYTTQLACGHRFHDECIVPKLNEAMSCPVCGREEHHKH